MRPRLGAAWQPLSPRWSLDGERILPDGYVKFVSTPAPAWVADKLPIYGAFFGLMVSASIPSHETPITWPVRAGR